MESKVTIRLLESYNDVTCKLNNYGIKIIIKKKKVYSVPVKIRELNTRKVGRARKKRKIQVCYVWIINHFY